MPPDGDKVTKAAAAAIYNQDAPLVGNADMVPTPHAQALAGLKAAVTSKSTVVKEMMGPPEAWKATRRAAILDFDLAPMQFEKRAVALLRLFDAPSAAGEPTPATSAGHRIKAYWVPYRNGAQSGIQLGADANYMFTNALSGCRLTVVPDAVDQMKTPLVLHIAGAPPVEAGLGKSGKGVEWRDEIQAATIRRATKVPANLPPPLVRAYSSTKDVKNGGYETRGGVIVVGLRNVTTGVWSFVAQWHNAATNTLHLDDVLAG
jgi:hypothetical protein